MLVTPNSSKLYFCFGSHSQLVAQQFGSLHAMTIYARCGSICFYLLWFETLSSTLLCLEFHQKFQSRRLPAYFPTFFSILSNSELPSLSNLFGHDQMSVFWYFSEAPQFSNCPHYSLIGANCCNYVSSVLKGCLSSP